MTYSQLVSIFRMKGRVPDIFGLLQFASKLLFVVMWSLHMHGIIAGCIQIEEKV